MFCKPIISVKNLSKCYQLYDQPADRLKQFLWRGKRQYFREFWALRDVSFDVMPGEVLGIIGRNGAGKSTLLQLLCGTLTPTSGSVEVNGRVAALLELGAGFNPEFTGRENVYLSAAILGLSDAEIADRFESIVAFSGIRDFIDQPVKTYSSGMYVRLAFSVATSVDPDILIIDEALSVGDGAFARKSFDRIMQMKDNNTTIVFCSHALFQIEAICDSVFWINSGRLAFSGKPADAVTAYNNFLSNTEADKPSAIASPLIEATPLARITSISTMCDGVIGKELIVKSRISTLSITIDFACSPELPVPSIAVVITDLEDRKITSCGTVNDNMELHCDTNGHGSATIVYTEFPLLKGHYWVYGFLLCEKGIHIYEIAHMCAKLIVEQDDFEVGLVSIPHQWLDNTVET